MTAPHDRDDLMLRYHEASAQDQRRPADRVRKAVQAHARMLAAANKRTTESVSAQVPAANQSRWRVSMFASVLLAGLAGLLMLQFDRGTPQEKELLQGVPVPGVTTASPASPAPPLPQAAPGKNEGEQTSATAAASKPPTGALPVPGSARFATELSAAKRSMPEPFPAAQPTDARKETEPRQDMDTQSQTSGRVALKAAPAPAPAPAPEAAGATAPAPPPPPPTPPPPPPAAAAAPTAIAVPLPAPAIQAQAQAEARPSNRSGILSEGLLQKDSEAAALQAPRQSALARAAQAPASALHEAARSGRLPELERQLAIGTTQLNAADAAGRTPLMLAVMGGHADAVQRLLAAGANRALVDHDGLTALQHARRLGRERIAAMIEAGS